MKGAVPMNKNLIQKIKLIGLIMAVISFVGCKKIEDKVVIDTEPGDIVVELETPKDPDEIMKEFYQMINSDETTGAVKIFLNDRIKNLDVTKADTMILDYEGNLIQNLNVLLKEYEKANSNPELSKVFDLGVVENISNVKDESLKELLNRTLDGGYILLKGEGYIYPEIDYGEMLAYKEYISKSVLNYIEIMDLETSDRFTYGEEIEIPLKDLLNRALKSEEYLLSNTGARTTNKIYELYVEYIDAAILGTGNPFVLANEGTSIIKKDILNEYINFVKDNKDSRTSEFIQEYIDILGENDNDMDAPEVIEFYDNRNSSIKDKFRNLGL